MADEARINCSLYIKKNNLLYQSQPTSFQADVTGTKGPVPGAITIPVGGKVIDLGELVTPGLYKIVNLDEERKAAMVSNLRSVMPDRMNDQDQERLTKCAAEFLLQTRAVLRRQIH